MLTKLFRPSGMALGILIASLFFGTNVLAKDWHHHKHYKSRSARHEVIKQRIHRVSAGHRTLQALQDQMAALEGDVEALKKLVEALQVDLEQQVGELSTELESVQSDMADLQSWIEADMGDVEAMTAQLAEQEAAAGMLEADLQVLRDQIELLEQAKQNGILESCPSGFAMQQVLPDGSVVCEQLGDGSASSGQLATSRSNRAGPVGPGQNITVSAMCPGGTLATGGGYVGSPQLQVYSSYSPNPGAWSISALNTDLSSVAILRVEAYCASVQ